MMKKLGSGIGMCGMVLILICAASSVWADVALHLPPNITMVLLNGKNANATYDTTVPEGLDQVVVRFEGALGMTASVDGLGSRYSDAFVLKFNAAGKALEMQAPFIDSENKLEQFNKNPNIKILDSTGKAIPVQIGKLEKSGFQIVRDFEKEILLFNETESSAAITRTEANVIPGMPVQPEGKGMTVLPKGESKSVVMLKYWYQKADEDSRKAFKEWMNRQ